MRLELKLEFNNEKDNWLIKAFLKFDNSFIDFSCERTKDCFQRNNVRVNWKKQKEQGKAITQISRKKDLQVIKGIESLFVSP